MMESLSKDDVSSILTNRFIVVIGDSIQRGIYKDLVLLLQENRALSEYDLRQKGEYSFMGDELIEGGRKGKMHNGIAYKEVRQYSHGGCHLVRFYFTTRCYNNYVESILADLKKDPQPDILIMNSCLWDMTRYGCDAIVEYKENLKKLFDRLTQSLPASCLVIWNTTTPISNAARGGFLIPEIQFLTTTLRLDVLEANYYAQKVAVEHGFDVLDLHFYLRHHLNRRVIDGIHWDSQAHRKISCMLMHHICEAWNMPKPRRLSLTSSSYGSRGRRSFRGPPRPDFPPLHHHHDHRQVSMEAPPNPRPEVFRFGRLNPPPEMRGVAQLMRAAQKVISENNSMLPPRSRLPPPRAHPHPPHTFGHRRHHGEADFSTDDYGAGSFFGRDAGHGGDGGGVPWQPYQQQGSAFGSGPQVRRHSRQHRHAPCGVRDNYAARQFR